MYISTKVNIIDPKCVYIKRKQFLWNCSETMSMSKHCGSWWRHQMETFSALLAICAGNSPVTGEFSAQGPVTRNFDVFFHLCLNKRLSKQSRGWWFETPSRSWWRHCNVLMALYVGTGAASIHNADQCLIQRPISITSIPTIIATPIPGKAASLDKNRRTSGVCDVIAR